MDGDRSPFDPDRGEGAAGVPDAVAGLDLVRRGVGLLQAAPMLSLSDAELRDVVSGTVAARAALEAGYLHTLAALDARGPDAVPGASASAVAATFLVHATNAAPVQAGRDVRAAKALAGDGSGIVPLDEEALAHADAVNPGGLLPRVGAALASGLVSRGHVDVAVRCLARIPKRLLTAVDEEGRSGVARVDAFLAEHARRLGPGDLDRVGAQLVAILDPDAADGPDPDARRRRFLSMRTGPDGMWHGSFVLDAAAGAVVKAAIEMVVKEQVGRPDPGHAPPSDLLSDADGGRGDTPDGAQVGAPDGGQDDPADAGNDGGQGVLPIGDDRSVGQRRADALHQVCLDALRGGRTGAPTSHVSVVATPDQIRDALAITLDEPRAWPEPRPARYWTEPPAEPESWSEPQAEPEPWTEPHAEPEPWSEPHAEPEPWSEPHAEPEPWTEPHAEAEAELWTGPHAEPEPWTEPRPASWTEPHAEPRPGGWTEPRPEPWTGPHAEPEPELWTEPHAEPEPASWTEPGTEACTGPAARPAAAAGLPPPARLRAAGLATDGWGNPLAPAVLAQLLCGALLTPVLLDAHGAVLDLGRTTRLATAAQRRALTARDRGCVVPGCAVPAGGCEAHHVIWWRHHGTTDITNLALLCARHHSAVHSGHWQLRMIGGLPYVIAPPWADPTGRPRRNSLHTAITDAHRLGQHLTDTQLQLDLPGCDIPDRPGCDPPDRPGCDPAGCDPPDRPGCDPAGCDPPEPQAPQRE